MRSIQNEDSALGCSQVNSKRVNGLYNLLNLERSLNINMEVCIITEYLSVLRWRIILMYHFEFFYFYLCIIFSLNRYGVKINHAVSPPVRHKRKEILVRTYSND
jgi:hypothetical protein